MIIIIWEYEEKFSIDNQDFPSKVTFKNDYNQLEKRLEKTIGKKSECSDWLIATFGISNMFQNI